jgi:transposase
LIIQVDTAMRGAEKQRHDFLSHALYDSLIPKDHFVHRLRELLDWSDLARELDDCYRSKGRASQPPEMLLRVVIAQYLHVLSDRQMEEAMMMNIASIAVNIKRMICLGAASLAPAA